MIGVIALPALTLWSTEPLWSFHSKEIDFSFTMKVNSVFANLPSLSLTTIYALYVPATILLFISPEISQTWPIHLFVKPKFPTKSVEEYSGLSFSAKSVFSYTILIGSISSPANTVCSSLPFTTVCVIFCEAGYDSATAAVAAKIKANANAINFFI